ncbi:threonine dehydratase [Marivibrio halodurans]|uniref:Threonine dehydratase n=2 Tax=Marivibrio halodurans TaxID=2039722 RepID=A0A8J7S921_9PROT|nr:threonine dehydratase [Marivibrio halodurans]
MARTPTRAQIESAQELVATLFPGTAQYMWPLLAERTGCETWVKHENHTPTGAFKVRGGLVYIEDHVRRLGAEAGVITATRGNHGQSIATACRRLGARVTVVVPEGNSREKNAAMRAQGADLIVHGHDFQAAADHARERAAADKLLMLPSFHELLVRGVATYAMEFFRGCPDLDTVYVPIGLGSGICGVIAARDALGLGTEVVGVVAEGAPMYKLSFEAGRPVATNSADTMADGVACRVPVDEAFEIIRAGASRILSVSDAAIRAAIRAYYHDTHNIAEGAGAAPLAALMAEREAMRGRKVGLVLTGGNIDRTLFLDVLGEADAGDEKDFPA